MQQWNWVIKNGLKYISLEEWVNSGVNIAFSSRQGGVSPGVYDSLNLGLHVGDNEDSVIANRRRYLSVFETGVEDVVCVQQVHGDKIVRVEPGDRGKGALRLETAIPDCDAMLTNSPGIYLLSFYADCLPIYFFDPVNRAVAIAHAGWKGTMERIALKTLQAMQKEFDSSVADMKAFIGPGIGPCCFFIQDELKNKVMTEFDGWHDIMNGTQSGSFSWDLAQTNRKLLLDAGMVSDHVTICNLCTSCHTESFYSYRQEHGKTGRMGALIGLQY